MELHVKTIDGIVVVTYPDTHLDVSNYHQFREKFDPILAEAGKVLIDLGTLQFIDSSGIGALLACLRKAHSEEKQLRLCRVTDSVRVIFDLVRMERIMGIDDTREESLNILRKE